MANTGSSSVFFQLVAMIPYGDKIGHFFLFGLLTLGINTGLKFRCIASGGLRVYLGAVLVLIFVVVEELSQMFFPNRTLDFTDLVADFAGVLVFAYVSYYLSKNYFNKSLK